MFSRVYPAWVCRPVLQGGPPPAAGRKRPARSWRVVAAGGPGVTAADAPHPLAGACERPVLVDRLGQVLAAVALGGLAGHLARHRQAEPQVRQAVLAAIDDQPVVAGRSPPRVDAIELGAAAQVLVAAEPIRPGSRGVAQGPPPSCAPFLSWRQ